MTGGTGSPATSRTRSRNRSCRAASWRNPYLAIPSVVEDIAGGSVPIFRISPVEAWRQIRSSRRIAFGVRTPESAGVSHHVVDAGAGTTVYRGTAYPPEFYGNVFVGDAQNNLVHRRVLVPDGPTFKAIRGPREQATEFVRSSDNWFRPVNFVNAPDGTLYVLDMSRAVIEAIHIPLDVVKHLDLKRGRDQGRIYRIAPPGFRVSRPPRLSRATTAELVAALARPDAWYRDTAHRLIRERRDPAAVEPLRKMIAPAATPFAPARVNALWSLEGLGALEDADLAVALSDPAPEVRAQAVALVAQRLNRSQDLLARVLSLAIDGDSRVRFRVALALGDTSDERAVAPLAAIARRDVANRWMRGAVLSSCAATADRLFAELVSGTQSAGIETLLEEIVAIVERGAALRRSSVFSMLSRPVMRRLPKVRVIAWFSRSHGPLAAPAAGWRSRTMLRAPAMRLSRGCSGRPRRAHSTRTRVSPRSSMRSKFWEPLIPMDRVPFSLSGSRPSNRRPCSAPQCGRWPRTTQRGFPRSCCRVCVGSVLQCRRPRSEHFSGAPTGREHCCEP